MKSETLETIGIAIVTGAVVSVVLMVVLELMNGTSYP